MSSATKRNKPENERDPHDYYPTPAWCIHRLLEKVALPTTGQWFEPAVGDGAIVRAVNSWFEERGRKPPEWLTNDIRADAAADHFRDFAHLSSLDFFRKFPISVFITNPPFALADRFLEHALRLRNPLGNPPIIVMLLRLQWMATHGRADMMQRHTPTLAILPDRPNYTLTGNQDMCEYAWHLWEHPEYDQRVIILDATDSRLRKGLPTSVYATLFPGRVAPAGVAQLFK